MTNLPELPQPSKDCFGAAHEVLMHRLEPHRAYYGWVDAPVGRLFVARTARGLCRVSYRQNEDELLGELEREALLPTRDEDRIDRERRELDEYFEGTRRAFDLPVDLRSLTPFQRQVLEAASSIPFGRCECYSDLATRIGKPRAQRAVGSALGKNPVPIVIPCHRVVAAGGRIGGYNGGVEVKRSLMGLEGIAVEGAS